MSASVPVSSLCRILLRGMTGALVALVLISPIGCGFFRAPDSDAEESADLPQPEPTPFKALTSAERRAQWKRKPATTPKPTAPSGAQTPQPSNKPAAIPHPAEPAAPDPAVEPEREVAMATRPSSKPLSPVDPSRRSEVVRLYHEVYLPSIRTPLHWEGSIDRCDAGSEGGEYTEATRQMVNYFRTMAGLRGDIVFDPTLNAKCRQAALSFIATPGLSHSIPRGWPCYSTQANEAAGHSNIALGYAGPIAVAKYIEEPWEQGFDLTHRQWILYSPTRRMGSGSVAGRKGSYKGANALWVQPAKLGPKSPSLKWVAWPPKGYVPYPVVTRFWSIAPHVAGRIDLRKASVNMRRENGETVSIRKGFSNSPYAPDAAVAWIPGDLGFGRGMRDETFDIEVKGIVVSGRTVSYRYAVTVIDPDI